METSAIIRKIIRVRNAIIVRQKCNNNVAMYVAYIKEIEILIAAHGKKWNEEGWRNFAKRQIAKLDVLIPANKAGETIKKQLYEQIEF